MPLLVVALLALAALPLVIAAGVAALRAPLRVLVPVYAALVPFGSGITVPIGIPPPFNTVTTLAGLGVIAVVGAQLLFGGGGERLHPSIPAWLLFAGMNGVTFLWSMDRSATFDRFVILASLVALYVVTLLVPIDRGDVERLRDGIIIGGTLACAYGFFLLLTGALPEEKAGLPRFATAGGVGDAADPNITAAVLILPLVLATSRAIHAERKLVRIGCVASALLIGTGLLLTASRGGMLAAALALVVLIAHDRRPLGVTITAVLLLVVIAAVGSVLAPEQFERLDKSGSSGRTNIWRVGLIACERHCLTGSGLNTFPKVHTETLLSHAGAAGVRLNEPPHNIWLGVAVELGVTGLVLLVIALATTVLPLRALSRAQRGPPVAALVGVLAANFFLANLYFKYFWLVLMYAAFEASAMTRPRVTSAPAELAAAA